MGNRQIYEDMCVLVHTIQQRLRVLAIQTNVTIDIANEKSDSL